MFVHNGTMFFSGGLMLIFWIVLILGIIFILKTIYTTSIRQGYSDTKKTLETLNDSVEIDESVFDKKRDELKR